jgi:hypothetical protein
VKAGVANSGFTLVEAVISAMLLALAIAGSYMLIAQTGRLIRGARNHYVAVNVAKSRVERARGFQYSDLWLLRETNLVVDYNGVPLSAGEYRRSTIVNTNYQPNLTLVTVDVEMRNQKTQLFVGEKESVACLFTEYLTP